MSFDLAVLSTSRPLTSGEAPETYVALCDGEDPADLEHLVASERMAQFMTALAERYPDLDTLSDDDVDDSPWSNGFECSDAHAILCIRWPRAEAMCEEVATLAAEHGLALYDPQQRTVNNAAKR